MSLQEAIEFLEFTKLDKDLDDKISQVVSSDAEKIDKYKSIIHIAKEKGYSFTMSEWEKALLMPPCDFDEDEKGYSFTMSEWEEALLMPPCDFDEDEFLNVAGGLGDGETSSNSKCKGIGWSM